VRLENPVDSIIEFTKTLFYSSDVYEHGIYFNSKAEGVKYNDVFYEYQLSKLIEKIWRLVDPNDGKYFVDEVLRREDIYWGPFVD
jgi:hypothetical protein